MEVYKDIPGYEGLYKVSNIGNVKAPERLVNSPRGSRLRKEMVLSQHISNSGYLRVGLCKGDKRRFFCVHQLVAMAFLDHKINGHKIVVDHINNDKIDNRVENLQTITNRENVSKNQKNRSSEYIGVSYLKKTNNYVSHIYIDGELKVLGRYKNEIEAAYNYQLELNKVTSEESRRWMGIAYSNGVNMDINAETCLELKVENTKLKQDLKIHKGISEGKTIIIKQLEEEITILKQYQEIARTDKQHRKGLLNKALEEIKQLKNK